MQGQHSTLDAASNFAEVKALAAEYPPDEQLQFWADTAKTFFNAYRALLESTTIPPASPAPSLQQPTSTMPQHTGTLLTSTTLPFDASSQKFKHDAFYGDQKNFLTTSGNSVALPKLLKGYELQDMANKAHTEAKKYNVHDYASLRRLQQGLAEFLSNAGFHALSQIIVTEGDPDHLVDTFQSYYTAHKTSSTSLDDLDKAIIQDNDLLLQLLSKTFTCPIPPLDPSAYRSCSIHRHLPFGSYTTVTTDFLYSYRKYTITTGDQLLWSTNYLYHDHQRAFRHQTFTPSLDRIHLSPYNSLLPSCLTRPPFSALYLRAPP